MTRRAAVGVSLALAAASACAGEPAAVGAPATLRVQIDLNGKEDGRTVRRSQVMQLRLRAAEPTPYNGLGKAEDEYSAQAVAARERRDARLEQRMAKARASQQQLDMDAIARACDRDPDSAACKSGQRAFAASIAEVDQAISDTAAERYAGVDPASQRYQSWLGMEGPDGSCGTVEGKVLDPGKPQKVARLPASAASAALDTCFSIAVIDTATGQLFMNLTPLEILWPGGQRGDSVIDSTDFGEGRHTDSLRNALMINAVPQSGSATYRGGRGTTVVRWSFQRG